MDLGPLTYLEINGQDVTHCIQREEPWTMSHQLHVLNQIESRPGLPNEQGECWMERRLTGKAIACCSCGYTTGLIDRTDLPPIADLAAQHPRATGQTSRSEV
jgi:hypothetical protein